MVANNISTITQVTQTANISSSTPKGDGSVSTEAASGKDGVEDGPNNKVVVPAVVISVLAGVIVLSVVIWCRYRRHQKLLRQRRESQ